MPRLSQKAANDCGRTILASLAARKSGGAEAIYAKLPKPPVAGYSLPQLAEEAAKLGLRLSPLIPASPLEGCDQNVKNSPAVRAHLRTIADSVNAGSPVIVIKRPARIAAHYVVVVGADDRGFSIYDPLEESLVRSSSAELAENICAIAYLALKVQ
ncbi:MAG: hypothetical protein K8H87_05750 [Pseudorhodoplanes sp.]|nr:hypothetical protein [Pseudorhodoplanes sp.]